MLKLDVPKIDVKVKLLKINMTNKMMAINTMDVHLRVMSFPTFKLLDLVAIIEQIFGAEFIVFIITCFLSNKA